MSDDIIGPIGGLIGIGVMAYAAKGLIDTLKDQTKEPNSKPKPMKIRAINPMEDRVWRMLK